MSVVLVVLPALVLGPCLLSWSMSVVLGPVGMKHERVPHFLLSLYPMRDHVQACVTSRCWVALSSGSPHSLRSTRDDHCHCLTATGATLPLPSLYSIVEPGRHLSNKALLCIGNGRYVTVGAWAEDQTVRLYGIF